MCHDSRGPNHIMAMAVLFLVVEKYKHNKYRHDSGNYHAFDELQLRSYLFGKVTARWIKKVLLNVK